MFACCGLWEAGKPAARECVVEGHGSSQLSSPITQGGMRAIGGGGDICGGYGGLTTASCLEAGFAETCARGWRAMRPSAHSREQRRPAAVGPRQWACTHLCIMGSTRGVVSFTDPCSSLTAYVTLLGLAASMAFVRRVDGPFADRKPHRVDFIRSTCLEAVRRHLLPVGGTRLARVSILAPGTAT